MATSFSGGRSQSTRREPLTMGKQLVNFITCGCESSAHFEGAMKNEQSRNPGNIRHTKLRTYHVTHIVKTL
jgi:hypothetical protein